MSQRDDILVWVDLEMTGLDPDSCAIVQMAMILTDRDLNEISEPLELEIWQPESVLETMGPFVRDMHTQNGLLEKVRASRYDLADAERKFMARLTKHAQYKSALLAGNSVWQDRRFLERYMPSFLNYLHYRLVDVSSVKELAKTWYGAHYEKAEGAAHTALFDIRQSIEELKFLREKIMR